MTASCTCCTYIGNCQTSGWAGREHLFSGREQVWRRSLPDKTRTVSAPSSSYADSREDDITCSTCLDELPMPIASSSKALPIYSPFSRKVELFRLRSERNSDSDDEEDIMCFEADDRVDSLNSLLVLEERQEGIRRYRSSVDDEHRLAHSESTARESNVPHLVEEEETCTSSQAPMFERPSSPRAKPSFMTHSLLFVLVAATVGLGFAALWRNNHQTSESTFLSAGMVPPAHVGLPSEQRIDQRPGSLRLEHLHNRNRLSFF